jgi:hypothetical protein
MPDTPQDVPIPDDVPLYSYNDMSKHGDLNYEKGKADA